METETIDRIPNIQPIHFKDEDNKPKKASGKSAKDYRIERDELQEKLDQAFTEIESLKDETKKQYNLGLQAGKEMGKTEYKHPALDSNLDGWYKRATAAEYKVDKLKKILGDVMKVITEGAL